TRNPGGGCSCGKLRSSSGAMATRTEPRTAIARNDSRLLCTICHSRPSSTATVIVRVSAVSAEGYVRMLVRGGADDGFWVADLRPRLRPNRASAFGIGPKAESLHMFTSVIDIGASVATRRRHSLVEITDFASSRGTDSVGSAS